MGVSKKFMECFSSFQMSRRNFVKGLMVLGSSSALSACSKGDDGEIIYSSGGGFNDFEPPKITEEILPFSGAHNCGGRGSCLSRALVKNGKVTRILTDESPELSLAEGNLVQARNCSRCRSYKGRINQPGRLKYPLKQTKERGDMTGFMRISWRQAAQEIAQELKNTIENVNEGPQAILNIYATANSGTMAGYGPFKNFLVAYAGGTVPTRGSYSTHQVQHMNYFNGVGTGNLGISLDNVMKYSQYVVLWGFHGQTTSNPRAWPMTQAIEGVKARGGKVYYIGPTMQDSCGELADEWIPIKPGTDAALCMAITYLLVHDLDTDGKNQAFIKRSSYGFYPSVGYWINADGRKVAVISNQVQDITDEYNTSVYNTDDGSVNPSIILSGNPEDWRYIKPVKEGESYNCYLEGKATWVKDANIQSSKYLYKQYMKTPKTPAWAESLTGVSESKITELANIYNGDAPVWTRRSYGVQRQYAGVYQIFAMDNMIFASGQWGLNGAGMDVAGRVTKNQASVSAGGFISHTDYLSKHLSKTEDKLSCTGWSVIAREPGFKEDGSIPQNNGGDVAARYVFKRNADWKPFSNTDPFSETEDGFMELQLDGNGKPIPVGIKVLFNMGGNITGNQHMDTFQTASWIIDRNYIRTHVVMDNFMSSSARYADYVLPDLTNLEREDIILAESGETWIATSEAQKGPGEAITIYDFCTLLCEELGKLHGAGSQYAEMYTQGLSYKQWIRKRYDATAALESAPFELQRTTYDEFRKKGIFKFSTDAGTVVKEKAFRASVDNPDVKLSPLSTDSSKKYARPTATPVNGTLPTGKIPMYARGLVEDYENRGYKVWGQLDKLMGTSNKYVVKNIDSEGDPIVYPIPVYFPPEEYITMDGMFDNVQDDGYGYLAVLSNHDKYRSHSTHNENPYLRELYKYSAEKFDAKGNRMLTDDFDTYASLGEMTEDGSMNIPDIGGDGLSQFWINSRDAEKRGIKHLDIIRAYNARGSVKVVANVTDRVVPGVALLTQGSWFDPREINGVKVDVGGSYNSIAGDYRSIADCGNAHMLSYVYVKKWDLD